MADTHSQGAREAFATTASAIKSGEIYMTRVKIAIVVSLTALAVVLAGCNRMAERPPTDLTVMTYNLYIGTELAGLFAITDPAQLPVALEGMYNSVVASNVPGRLAAIARMVKEEQPHLIGLQEVFVIHHPANPEINFREILMSALQAEGLNYEVVAEIENAKVDRFGAGATDYDLILARSDVEVTRATSATYATLLSLQLPGGEFKVKRGYAAVDATVGGVTYRVVNTHLEATLEALPEALKQVTQTIRGAQAQELVSSLSKETLPVVLLGDFNTPAPDGAAYQLLQAAGYVDVWEGATGSGNTCCQAPDLRNEASELNMRIDQIFVKGVKLRESASIRTATVGDKPEDRLATGQWPSDHAGVVAHLPVE